MLDLKAKLLAAGLVTEQQVKKVEEQEAARKRRADEHRQAREGQRRGGPGKKHDEKDRGADDAAAWQRRLAGLKTAPKGEQYDTMRGWVLKHRIDQKLAVPSEGATRFHFAKSDGAIGHMTLEPDVHALLAAGTAGIVAFMGHNGVEHAVVPADLARDIGSVKPEWLRTLTDPNAPPEPAADASAREAAAETNAEINTATNSEQPQ